MKGGWVYIMTNRRNGTLYTGVTADLVRRAFEHRTGESGGFTARYGLTRLVWFEHHQEIVAAIHREKKIKDWPRAWKIRLIELGNTGWDDLYDSLL